MLSSYNGVPGGFGVQESLGFRYLDPKEPALLVLLILISFHKSFTR